MTAGSPYSIPLVHSAVEIMTPFLLAGIGGLFTELSGMLNIALEGLILTGAFFSVVLAAATGSLLLGILLGILCAMLLALLFGSVTLYLRANVFITGLATNLFASGFTIVLAYHLFRTKGVIQFPNVPAAAGACGAPLSPEDPDPRGRALRPQHHRVRHLAHRAPVRDRHLSDPIRNAPARHRPEREDHLLPWAEPEALPAGRHSHLGPHLRSCRSHADDPARRIRAPDFSREGMDCAGGHLPGQQDSLGNCRGILRLRACRKPCRLRAGCNAHSRGFHPCSSLPHNGCRHDPLCRVAARKEYAIDTRCRRGDVRAERCPLHE